MTKYCFPHEMGPKDNGMLQRNKIRSLKSKQEKGLMDNVSYYASMNLQTLQNVLNYRYAYSKYIEILINMIQLEKNLILKY